MTACIEAEHFRSVCDFPLPLPVMPKMTVTAYPFIAPEGADFGNVQGDPEASAENKARSKKLAFAIRDVMQLVLPPIDPSLDELCSFRCSTTSVDGTSVVADAEMQAKLKEQLDSRALTQTQYRYIYDQMKAIEQNAGLTGIPFPHKPDEDGPEVALQFSTKDPAQSVDPPAWGEIVYRKVDSIIICEVVGGLYPNDDGSGNPLYIGLSGFKGGAWVGIALQIRLM